MTISDNAALLAQSSFYKRKGGKSERRKNSIPKDIELSLVKSGALKLPAPNTPNDYAQIVELSQPSSELSANSVILAWDGARLMTYNQLLHVGQYVRLVRYKKAWHQACLDAVMATQALKGFSFTEKVDLVITRRSHHFVDPDALVAMFKFIIDGVRNAGILAEDTRDYIRHITPIQEKGDYRVSIKLIPISGRIDFL